MGILTLFTEILTLIGYFYENFLIKDILKKVDWKNEVWKKMKKNHKIVPNYGIIMHFKKSSWLFSFLILL